MNSGKTLPSKLQHAILVFIMETAAPKNSQKDGLDHRFGHSHRRDAEHADFLPLFLSLRSQRLCGRSLSAVAEMMIMAKKTNRKRTFFAAWVHLGHRWRMGVLFLITAKGNKTHRFGLETLLDEL